MRGEIVFRVYGAHTGRRDDSYFGAFRSRAEAEAEVANLIAKEMHGRNWAAQYHDTRSCHQRRRKGEKA